jgi:casein kinase II subunit alpha
VVALVSLEMGMWLTLFFCTLALLNATNPGNSKMIVTTSRMHKSTTNSTALFDSYESLSSLKWFRSESIRILRFVDSGRFSNVFEALVEEKQGNPIILKVLKPTYTGKIKRELKVLEAIKESECCVKLIGATKNVGVYPKSISLLFESLGPDSQWLSNIAKPSPQLSRALKMQGRSSDLPMLTDAEIRLYIRKVLTALTDMIERGIMHRDIKPRNIIISRSTSELRVIDFGLSEFYIPQKQYNPSVASRHYKSPELLFHYLYYDYAVDIWSLGCVLAGLVFQCEPFFYGSDLNAQITCISKVVGSQEILQWIEKYNIHITISMKNAIGNYPKVPYSKFCSSQNKTTTKNSSFTSNAIDLIEKMLTIDHQKRFTVEECLAHPFFKED